MLMTVDGFGGRSPKPPAGRAGLGGYGLTVSECVSPRIPANPDNVRDPRTKQTLLGHLLALPRALDH
jgi:hypothetical protein